MLALVTGCSSETDEAGRAAGDAVYDARSSGVALEGGFDHRAADVDGVRIRYVIGGQGPAVVLLHGFPETWYA